MKFIIQVEHSSIKSFNFVFYYVIQHFLRKFNIDSLNQLYFYIMPLKIAVNMKHENIAQLLRDYGAKYD